MPTVAAIRAQVEREFEPLFRRLHVIEDLFDTLGNVNSPALTMKRHNVAVGLLLRGHATFQAVLREASYGFGQDAFFLARSLFEAMVSAKYLAANVGEIDDYWDYGQARKRRWVERLVTEGEASYTDLASFQTPKIDALMQKFSDANGKLLRSWNGKDIAALAGAVGETGRYLLLYGPMSDVGHGQVTGLWAYFVRDAAGDPVMDMKPSMESVDLALTGASLIAVELCDGVAGLLDARTPAIAALVSNARHETSEAIAELAARGTPP